MLESSNILLINKDMKIPFKEYHLFRILEEFQKSTLPLDAFLSQYFRTHKAVGSKDRKFIADTVYGIIRWRGLLDQFEKPASWETRYRCFQKSLHLNTKDETLSKHIRVSFPKWYYEQIAKTYGEKAGEICLISNECAPTTVRVNSLLITRDELLEKWKGKYSVSATQESLLGIRFHKKINFFASEDFKAGYFEVQDEGSQLISEFIDAKPGEQILDYCCGSGGKTLALAPSMLEKGQIYLHDIREKILESAKKRLRRACVQNAQILPSTSRQKKTLQGKMDKVLLDVPCSGSGTLRRNPDLKWRFRPENLQNLISVQETIFEESLTFVKTGGMIIYVTCSLFPEENEKQIETFCQKYPVIHKLSKGWLPESDGKDGFFVAVLEKR